VGGRKLRCLIFGGSGFIGSHLAEALCTDGAQVVIADLVEPTSLPAGATFVRCDVRRPITIDPGEGFDKVFHLAAVHRTPGHQPSEYYETNVLGAQHVTDWCEVTGQHSLIFTSSISVYGPSEELKSEMSEPMPNSDYGRSKLIAESLHRHWADSSSENRLTIVRPAVVFGKGELGNFTRLAHALARGRFMYAGRTDVIKSCGYVEDLVDAMLFVDGLGKPEATFNFCYDHRYTIEEICQGFTAVAGYKLPHTLPPRFLKAAMATLRVVNPKNRGPIVAARIAKLTLSTNIEPAFLREHGYSWPTTLEGGLQAWLARSGTGTFE
jgi:nucleoside-diphosphate-sugar epimerase